MIPKPAVAGRLRAMIVPDGFLPFDRKVPRLVRGWLREAPLTEPDVSTQEGAARCS